MSSYWEQSTLRPRFDMQKKKRRTDVLIIGGGMTGVLCAYRLHRAGIDCMLLEADEIGSGITKNTTAKITFCHGLLYDGLIKKFGKERTALYLRAQRDACAEYERLCQSIPCDYEKKDSFVYSLGNREKLKQEVEALNILGVNAVLSDTHALPFETAGAVHVEGQAQFHPLKFLFAIAQGLPIYEHTKVKEIGKGKVTTADGEILCEKIIVATHFPILNKHGGYFLKLHQHRSYVLALIGAGNVGGIYVDESKTGLSFRNAGDLLLLGGGAHRTGKKGGAYRELEAFARTYYPKASIVGRWATQDCMTLDGIPYIGRYAKSTPDLFVATGYNKWGMSSSMMAASVLCDLVQGKSNAAAAVLSPSRSVMHPTLLSNIFSSVVGLLTPTVPRCPHLGCALKYNAAEHSWDCPCHGSRFTEEGELIDGPATDDKKNMR